MAALFPKADEIRPGLLIQDDYVLRFLILPDHPNYMAQRVIQSRLLPGVVGHITATSPAQIDGLGIESQPLQPHNNRIINPEAFCCAFLESFLLGKKKASDQKETVSCILNRS